MTTVDRINRLITHYGGIPIPAALLCSTGHTHKGTYNSRPTHTILDHIDRRARLVTTGQVGARLAQHEAKLPAPA